MLRPAPSVCSGSGPFGRCKQNMHKTALSSRLAPRGSSDKPSKTEKGILMSSWKNAFTHYHLYRSCFLFVSSWHPFLLVTDQSSEPLRGVFSSLPFTVRRMFLDCLSRLHFRRLLPHARRVRPFAIFCLIVLLLRSPSSPHAPVKLDSAPINPTN